MGCCAPADPSGAGVEEAEECPLRGLTGSFLWFTSPFSFAATAANGGVRGRMPFWCTGDDELLLLPVCREKMKSDNFKNLAVASNSPPNLAKVV